MTLLPAGMFGRTLLIVAALLVSVASLTIPLADFFLRSARAERLAVLELNRARLIVVAYRAVSMEGRPGFAQELAQSQGIGIATTPPARSMPAVAGRDFFGTLVAEIQRHSETEHAVRVGRFRGRQGLWIDAGGAVDSLWVFLPRPPPVANRAWPWIASAGIALALAILGAAAIVWRINRPLRELTAAAQRLTRGESTPPLTVRGPREIKTLSTVFNRMNAELERSDAERKLLLAGVSHDVRTPLTRLRLALDALPENTGSDLKQTLIADVEDIDTILEQFLSFAHDLDDEARVDGNLDEFVATICDRYARTGKAVSCELAGPPLVSFYPIGLRRVVTNLIDNALKHGGGSAQVQTRHENGRAVIAVRDQGPGIPESEIPKMLQPFQRLDRARGVGGAGLGLAITKRIARQHGGALRLRNRTEGGLVVTVDLPLQMKTERSLP